MELYLSPKVVGKGQKGRTACGSSAYRSCDRIIDNAGHVHDYRNKTGYVTGGIELPEGAPAELLDRQTLWQRHELRDVRKDAELFREVTLALSNELSYAAAEKVVRKLAKKLTDLGMCVQWDIHDTTKEGQRNLHAHLMITMRELLPDGSFGNKNRSWNRYNGGLNIADLLRPEAARLMNEELARIGSSERVEHESFADRGIDKIPTKHMGVAATAMERKGVKTNKGRQNRYIDWLNQIHAENLQEIEQKTQRLDILIGAAENTRTGTTAYKDWDALFALLRDTRRCKAALAFEDKKFSKLLTAWESGDSGYLKWAGCDPESDSQHQTIIALQKDLRVRIRAMEITENWILNSKDLFKAHNRVVYAAKKADYDNYLAMRHKRSMEFFFDRLMRLNRYIDFLEKTISLLDIIFYTQEFQNYLVQMGELQKKRAAIQEAFAEERAAMKEAKRDLRKDKRELKKAEKAARQAKKEEKAVRKKVERNER